jgi:hypothetical protein
VKLKKIIFTDDNTSIDFMLVGNNVLLAVDDNAIVSAKTSRFYNDFGR